MKKKYRILHLSTHLNLGGITSWLLTAAPALKKRGHEVSIAAGSDQTAAAFEALGVRVHRFDIRTKSEIHPKLLFALPGLASLVKRERFDVLHAHTRVTQVLAKLAGAWTGVPFVSTAHGFYKARLGRRLFDAWGARVVAVSPLVAEELSRSHGVAASRIRVVPNAVDAPSIEAGIARQDRTAVRGSLGIPGDALVVTSISRLVKDKGHEYLVEAAALLADEMPRLHAVILGDGRERPALEEQIRSRGLEGRVHLVAGVPDVTGVLAATDFFIHPATFREGFGLSIAEAMVARKPVVATDIWAINTLLRGGREAILVPPKDAGALADAVRFLAGSPAEARAMAERGYAFAAQVSSLDRMADALENVYREAVEGG
ncbi:MAG TPA: glycosyltransferase [Candidatus Eisenbacteria bacterium]|nr:glycosyltransferase [Candidatus Eisenbacteria bacterium]